MKDSKSPNYKEIREMLSGVFTPISTPFEKNEDVNYEALESNLRFYAQTKLRGYLALGSNGENKCLSEDEKLKVLETIIKHKGKNKVVLAGTAYEAQRDTERFLKSAYELGAEFGLVLAPSYYRRQMTEDVLYEYYSTLADTSRIPILLYNAPGFNGIELSPQLVKRLSVHTNIVGMKDSASSGYENFLRSAGDNFFILAGSANFLFPSMMSGAIGGTVSLANSFPELAIELFNYGLARDEVKGVPLQDKVRIVNTAISGKHGVSGVKAAMDLGGLWGGIPRRPLLPLNATDIEDLRSFLILEGVIKNV